MESPGARIARSRKSGSEDGKNRRKRQARQEQLHDNSGREKRLRKFAASCRPYGYTRTTMSLSLAPDCRQSILQFFSVSLGPSSTSVILSTRRRVYQLTTRRLLNELYDDSREGNDEARRVSKACLCLHNMKGITLSPLKISKSFNLMNLTEKSDCFRSPSVRVPLEVVVMDRYENHRQYMTGASKRPEDSEA